MKGITRFTVPLMVRFSYNGKTMKVAKVDSGALLDSYVWNAFRRHNEVITEFLCNVYVSDKWTRVPLDFLANTHVQGLRVEVRGV